MARMVQAPNEVYPARDEYAVFLAGGITDCPDWQKEFAKKTMEYFDNDVPVVLMNPRRDDFDVSNPNETVIQIKWEFDHLQPADIIVFWFCAETTQPIVLYELGFQLGKKYVDADQGAKILIGVDPKYERRNDVFIQAKCAEYPEKIASTVDDLVKLMIAEIYRDGNFSE